ncbi:MAG TPA: hypothetical protein DCW74_10350, partial [Alteromonas australica]|nr:hypothetical protein [Alteromonas australica]
MTFVDRKAHRPTFIVSIDGFPFHFVEEKQPITLTVAISGDLNSASEFMRCFVNDTQIGGDLSTGFQDGTLRDIITDEDVTAIVGENPVVKISGFGS